MSSCEIAGATRKYAVLINGDSWNRYTENLWLAHKVLAQNGYREENIHIFDCAGKQDKSYPVQGPAIFSAIENQFVALSRIITPQDHLFVYTTDHGDLRNIRDKNGNEIEVSTVRLAEGRINEIEMARLVENIRPKIGIFLFDQCYSGGFAQRLAGPGRITIAACSARQPSKGRSFPESFFGAFLKNRGDNNDDGQVSIQEAFSYALENDRYASSGEQSPMMLCHIKDETFL